jgi:predicted ribosomally synthesized peptide with SipW-like signal peptide
MKKIITSALNLFLLSSLFFGATLAYFTDTITNEDNIITIGNLKVSMVAADDFTELVPGGGYNLATNLQDLKQNGDPVFDFSGGVEPGQSLTRFIRIGNAGSIAMSYDVSFVVNEYYLEQYIDFSFSKMNLTTGGAGAPVNRRGDYFPGLAFSGLDLVADEFEIYRVTIVISNTLGNDFNSEAVSSRAFDFDVSLLARQASFSDPS